MIFENIELVWQGQEYVIPANKVMGAIARVEDVVTLAELQAYAGRRGAPLGKLSMAYGALLRYAGARVADDDIYLAVFKGEDQGNAVIAAITNVMALMIPPSVRRDLADGKAAAASAEVPPQGNA